MRILGIILLVGGILAAAYGGFTYVQDSETVDLGVAEVTVRDEERVRIPLWVGLTAAAIGGVMIGMDRRGKSV